jgi:ketosteroid isomerase-like protein
MPASPPGSLRRPTEEVAVDPSPELETLTRRLAEAVGAGDAAFVRDLVAQRAPVAFLGTDPAEWWTDADALARALAAQGAAGVEVLPGEPVAYAEGDVGWAVDRRLRFRHGGQEVPCRMTVVYRREGGAWRLVHFHASIPVGNEAALGVDLTEESPNTTS